MSKIENLYAASDYYNSVQQKSAGKTDNKKSSTTKTAGQTGRTGQAQLSKKAQNLLEKLRKTYGNMDFMVADYKSSEDARDILSRGTKEVSVLFSTEEIEKMASSEKYEKEYMQRVQGALNMSEQINQQFGFKSAFGQNADGVGITKLGISFNKDGTTSFFAELEKSSEQQRARIEKAQENKRKHTTVYADSMESLVKKIQGVDWDSIRAADEPDSGRKFNFSV